MTISTRDQLIDALANNSSRVVVDKASLANAAAGQFFSMWQSAGIPAAGVTPTTATIPTNATTGAIGFTQQTSPATSYLAWLRMITSNANQSLEVHDRVAHMGGLNGTLIAAQNALIDLSSGGLNLEAARLGDANFSDIQWWLEIYTALGATGVNATVNVTYDDASSGNLAVIALGATPRAGRLYPLISAVAGRFIRDVNTVTLSATTGTAGNFGVTATRPRSGIDVDVANKGQAFDWAQLGLPEVPNNACLMLIAPCSTTSTGTFRGSGKIAHG
jgi:hypothetical protein